MGSNKDEKNDYTTVSSESLNIQPLPKPSLFSSDVVATPPSHPYPIHPPPITSTPDMKDFGFGMNLSRISERTEFTDWSKSELDKTANTNNSSYKPDVLSSLSEKQKSVESASRSHSSKLVSSVAEKEKSSPKTRSVFWFLIGCLFPFCRPKV